MEERIDERIGSFDSAISFAGATHPGPLGEYQMFMQNEVEKTQASDPGVMFFERVNVADIPALEAREAALGNDEFSATVFPGPTDERVLLTRISYESELFGVSLLGLDATGLSGTLIPQDFGSQSFELYVSNPRTSSISLRQTCRKARSSVCSARSWSHPSSATVRASAWW